MLSGKIIGVARVVCNGQETLLREYSTRLRLDPKRGRAKCKREVCGVEDIEHPFCLLACSCSSWQAWKHVIRALQLSMSLSLLSLSLPPPTRELFVLLKTKTNLTLRSRPTTRRTRNRTVLQHHYSKFCSGWEVQCTMDMKSCAPHVDRTIKRRNWPKKLRFESILRFDFSLEISGFLMVVHHHNANTHTRGKNADNLMHLDSCIWDFADRIAFLAVVRVIYPSCVWSRYFFVSRFSFLQQLKVEYMSQKGSERHLQ